MLKNQSVTFKIECYSHILKQDQVQTHIKIESDLSLVGSSRIFNIVAEFISSPLIWEM